MGVTERGWAWLFGDAPDGSRLRLRLQAGLLALTAVLGAIVFRPTPRTLEGVTLACLGVAALAFGLAARNPRPALLGRRVDWTAFAAVGYAVLGSCFLVAAFWRPELGLQTVLGALASGMTGLRAVWLLDVLPTGTP
jgi:hypothetical protein